MPKVLITTVPFGVLDSAPLEQLAAANIEYVINPLGRKLNEQELADLVGDFDVLIAGTEPITGKVIQAARRLKLISRVGIGLDSVDLLAAERHGVLVSYTPDAPAPAVAELALGLMFALMRSTHIANAEMHRGEWKRHFGRRMCDVTVGIIGAGRIGTRVIGYLSKLGFKRVLVNDVLGHLHFEASAGVQIVDKQKIYQEADLISLHLPLNMQTKDLIKSAELLQMKPNVMIINTSRGGIINEQDLADVLKTGHLGGAAIDVFEQEPYSGPLAKIDRCLLTSHMGSMSADCRTRMEIEATEEAVRFLMKQPLMGLVPRAEYDIQRQGF
jgi:D-3-phosphoglycerate dehydrogenase